MFITAYVYSVGHETVTKDPIILSDPSCTADYDIPPVPDLFSDNIPAAAPFKGGVIMFGLGSSHNYASYWLPGDDKWSDLISVGTKRQTNVVSIRGNTEVVAINSRGVSGGMSKNIVHYDGTVNLALTRSDEKMYQATLIAWDEVGSFYVFGGERQAASPLVLKYEAPLDTWTVLEDMPSGGGAAPSCGKATYNGRVSVICLGTETHLSNDIEIFDLETEAWTTKANIMTPANPPTYGSLVFSRGTKLYRVRGFYDSNTPANSYDVLDLDTMVWEAPVPLEPSDVKINQLVLIDT